MLRQLSIRRAMSTYTTNPLPSIQHENILSTIGSTPLVKISNKCIVLIAIANYVLMWKQRESPSRIEKRFEFEEYQKISIFLKKTDELCKEKNIYPNISFGKNFVSVSIFLDSEEIPSNEKEFSIKLDDFFLEE